MTQKMRKEKYMLQYDVNRLTAKNIQIKEELALAQDTIRIALKTVGYQNVDTMSQFKCASALLDMAQEFTAHTRIIDGELYEAVVWERVDEGEGS